MNTQQQKMTSKRSPPGSNINISFTSSPPTERKSILHPTKLIAALPTLKSKLEHIRIFVHDHLEAHA